MESKKIIIIAFSILLINSIAIGDVILTEDFEGDVSAWTFGTTGQENKWECGTATYYNGSKSAYISWDGGTTATYKKDAESTSWLEKEVDLTGYSNAYLSFYWKCEGQGGALPRDYGEVYVNNDRVSDYREFVSQSSWTQKTSINLSSYVGGIVTLKFKWHNNSSAGNDPPFCVDDIEITGTAGHDFATLDYATDSRSMQDTTVGVGSEVTFHIVAKNLGTVSESSPIKWICTGGSPTIDGENTGILAPNSTEHHIFSLNWTAPSSPDTCFVKFYTDLATDSDHSNDTTTVKITVLDIQSLPVIENFDTVSPPNLPTGWSVENTNTDIYTWITNIEYPYSPLNSMAIHGNPIKAMNDWFFTPPISLQSGTTYKISFWYSISDSSTEHKIEVKWGNSNSSSGMTSGPIFADTTNSTSYIRGNCNITPTSNGVYYIGWHGYGDANNSKLFIDNISITEWYEHDFATLSHSEDNRSMFDRVVTPNDSISFHIVAKNTGTSTESSPIKWTCTGGSPSSDTDENTSTLAPDSTENHIFSPVWIAPSTPGIYYVKFYTDIASDMNHFNDTTTVKITVCNPQSVPVTQDFDGVTAPDIPEGWSVESNNDDGYLWYVDDITYHSFPNDMRIFNNQYKSMDDWFFSPPLFLESGKSYNISFYYGSEGITYNQNLDVMWGTSATSEGMTQGPIFTDTTDYQGKLVFNYNSGNGTIIPTYDGVYYVGWHGYSNTPQGFLCIDDIEITQDTTHNFATLDNATDSRSMQDTTIVAGSSITFHIVAENLGTIAESSPIKWICTGGSPTSDIDENTASLSPNSTEHHIFSPSWTAPSIGGIYTVKFYTDLADDIDRSNDTTTVQITVLDMCSGLPITEDFESGFDKFDNAINNDVDWILNDSLYHSSTHSSWNSYGINNENILIQTCVMDLTSEVDPYLKFWHIAKTEGGNDKCYVDISVDLGNTWLPLPGFLYLGSALDFSTKGYFDEDSYSDWGTGDETPDNTWWKQEIFDLSGYTVASQVMLRFRLVSNSAINRYGWLIDDISIKELTVPEEPFNPNPEDYADSVCICCTNLSWTNGLGTESLDLFFGTDYSAVNSMDPSVKIIDNQYADSYTFADRLLSDTQYYWKILARNNEGETPGSLWRFTTIYCDTTKLEDFETGDFSSFSWIHSGDANWFIEDSVVCEGIYSAQSGNIGNNQTSELSINMDIELDGYITFCKKVSSESNWDKLVFYIDGVEQESWSGELDWSCAVFPVSAGLRTFKWSYEKNITGSAGDDCAWIDCICFPSAEITQPNPPENVTINIVGNDVQLNWDDVSEANIYYIYRSLYPYSGFSKIDSSFVNSYTDTDAALTSTSYFYRITADNSAKGGIFAPDIIPGSGSKARIRRKDRIK